MTAEGYEVRTDLADMDFDRIHPWLSTDAYWAKGRTRDNMPSTPYGRPNSLRARFTFPSFNN